MNEVVRVNVGLAVTLIFLFSHIEDFKNYVLTSSDWRLATNSYMENETRNSVYLAVMYICQWIEKRFQLKCAKNYVDILSYFICMKITIFEFCVT